MYLKITDDTYTCNACIWAITLYTIRQTRYKHTFIHNILSHTTYNISVMTYPSNPPTSSFWPIPSPNQQKSQQHRQASIFQQLMTEVIIGQGHQLPWQAFKFLNEALEGPIWQRFLHVLVGENEERMCEIVPLTSTYLLRRCFGYVLDMFLGSKYIKYLLSGMSWS